MKQRLATFLREEWLQVLLLALPVLSALAALPFATNRVPMQWGLDGRVNWYAPKEWGLLVMPVTMVLTFGLVFWLESRDPARHREADGTLSPHGRATRSIRLGISVMLAAVSLIQISAALGRHPDVSRLIPSLVALLIAFLGNFFGKLKPNRYAGIRVPWTLNSENVWRITHRISGWIYTASSLVFLAAIWLLPQRCQTWLFAGWIAALVVAPLFIAWRAAVAERQGKTLSS
jgi:uncharacterized membrane protein